MTRQPRYDMGPVLERCQGSSAVDLERATGISRRQFQRWLRVGVPHWSADTLAVRLGLTPTLLWPEWEQGIGSPAITDWTETRRADAAAASAALAAATTARPRFVDDEPLRSPGAFAFPRRPASAAPPQAGMSADLVFIFPEWLANSPNPPGSPPRKEEATCDCRLTDDFGRPRFIGWCGPDCERRSRG